MKFVKSKMKQLVKENEELKIRLKQIMKEHELEKDFALKAMYHTDVVEGKFQAKYQELS
ncbi:hypothetical protein MHH33_16155 [Paenisporosarcina sp. FSL H8-0542]|uniref:hypothetical protein n=1 Tax=unclassified Paenisporosarcina TaxID=2642018 RepID=UPI00034E309E|nr:hypothetical protein [Paenisporosarcina sp. HGH0030]EPD51441.1 hypothetical protein HMPREF1210_02039 [Paenisporosarcina sp. HGH0030]